MLNVKENKEKTGVFTGSYVINPVNGQKLPIWVAVMFERLWSQRSHEVPAHDGAILRLLKMTPVRLLISLSIQPMLAVILVKAS